MYNKNYLAKRPFMLVHNTHRPARGANTAKAGWADENGGQWSVFENISFVDRVKNKDMANAVAIIDVLEAKAIKSNFQDAKNDDVVRHYLSKYKQQTTEAIGIWMEARALERAKAGLPPEELQSQLAVETGSEDISAANIQAAFAKVAAEKEAASAKANAVEERKVFTVDVTENTKPSEDYFFEKETADATPKKPHSKKKVAE